MFWVSDYDTHIKYPFKSFIHAKIFSNWLTKNLHHDNGMFYWGG